MAKTAKVYGYWQRYLDTEYLYDDKIKVLTHAYSFLTAKTLEALGYENRSPGTKMIAYFKYDICFNKNDSASGVYIFKNLTPPPGENKKFMLREKNKKEEREKQEN